MNFSSNGTMGRANREKPLRDGVNSEPSVDSNDDEVPMDLSMPRYPNRKKDCRGGNSYYAAGRRKQPSSYDVDANEQPIDYSKKYVESNSSSTVKTNYVPRNSLNRSKIDQRDREKGFSHKEEKAYPYGDYAETDLDQPTDYSLRYAEDDTDDDEKPDNVYFNNNEQEDTVKTYCTEGTPYETPFNVSSATSMSDLRLEDSSKDSEAARRTRKILQDSNGVKDSVTKRRTPLREEHEKEAKEEKNEILSKESKNMSNELVLNSSNVSIEKPVNYYVEDTPGGISRVSSLSSLGCTNGTRNEDTEEITESLQVKTNLTISPNILVDRRRETINDAENSTIVDAGTTNDDEETGGIDGSEEEKGDSRVVDKEGKVVTFGGEDHYAEQTPLMFSRSSSLGSLSGFEQHSIHDDRSSIVSDFSRRTSGVVSPSELPDSPTQTVPPSPRHNQKNSTNDFSSRSSTVPPLRQFSYVKNPRSKSSIFEDNMTSFKEESTPLEFSAATSLSSLTIDDEPKIIMDTREKDYPKETRTVGRFLVVTSGEATTRIKDEKASSENVQIHDDNDRNQEQASDGDEDDEDILAACISVGMRNSMYKQSCKKSDIAEKNERISGSDSTTNLVRYQTSSTLDRLVADVAAVSITSDSKTKNSIDAVTVPSDTLRIYCTEDTPANITPVGSQSNLSALSMISTPSEIEKDEDNRLSEEDEDDMILDDCIKAGITRTIQRENSFAAPAAEFDSPNHASSSIQCQKDEETNLFPKVVTVSSLTQKSEVYLPVLDAGQGFPVPSPFLSKCNELLTSTSSATSNCTAVDHDTSGDDDNILDDCARPEIVRSLQRADSLSGTEIASEFNSPSHASSTMECQDNDKILDKYKGSGIVKNLNGNDSFLDTPVAMKDHSPGQASLAIKSDVYSTVDTRNAFSMSSQASTNDNVPPIQQSSMISNSITVELDTSVDDDKILNDCIRAGIERTLKGEILFPSNGTKHHSPRHTASTKKSKVHSSKAADNRQISSIFKSSPSKSKSYSTAVDHDTSGDDEKIADDCPRGMARILYGANSFPGSATTTKFNSPRHATLVKKCQDDNKNLDNYLRSGIASLQGSNSFPGTASASKHHSPRHASPMKTLEMYMPKQIDARQAFSTSSSIVLKNDTAPARRILPVTSNSMVMDLDTSGDDDKILDDCIRAGIARTLKGEISFSSTSAVTKHNSPRHATSTKKSKVHLSRAVCNRQASSISKSSSTKNKFYSATDDHDTSGDDDKIVDDCIRAGMARSLHGANSFPGTAMTTKMNSPRHTFWTKNCHDDDKTLGDFMRFGITKNGQGSNSFPGTAAASKHHSPRHASPMKKLEMYLPRPVENRQAFSLSSLASAKSNETPARRTSSMTSHFMAVDLDTSGDDDKILDDCIRAGIARTLKGEISFSSTTTVKHHSPRHATSTKKSKVYLSRDSRQASSTSKSSPAKSKLYSTVIDHDTSGDDEKIVDDYSIRNGIGRNSFGANSFPGTAAGTKFNSPRHTSSTKKFHDDDKIFDDCTRSGFTRIAQGSNSFPGTAPVSKHHSPRHAASMKKSKKHLLKSVDSRQTHTTLKMSGTKSRFYSSGIDHDTSGDEDKIVEDCIRAGMARTFYGANSFPGSAMTTKFSSPRHAPSTRRCHIDKISDDYTKSGIARTLQGSNSFPGTASTTKHNSPRHTTATKKSEIYPPRLVDTRQSVSLSLSSTSPARSNDPSTRCSSSARSNFASIDHDTSGDDDKILDDCIRAGIARTLGAVSFPNTAMKLNSPRHAFSTKKSEDYLSKSVNSTRQAFPMSLTSLTHQNDTHIGGALSSRLNSAAVDYNMSTDDDKILEDCIRAGIARTLQGDISFPSTAGVIASRDCQTSRKCSKSLVTSANLNEISSCSSSRVTTEVSRTSVMRILSSATNRVEESFGHNSSLSGDEENTILSQCIRAGMPGVSNMPPKDTIYYQRDERRMREQ